MKKLILFIFVIMFTGFDAFAGHAKWHKCFEKLQKDPEVMLQMGDYFFGEHREIAKEDYAVYDEDGNIIGIDLSSDKIALTKTHDIKTFIGQFSVNEKERVIRIVLWFMSTHCDEMFADIASEAYKEEDEEISFIYTYKNKDIRPGYRIIEHATIKIHPKEDFIDRYPKIYAYWVSDNSASPLSVGDIVSSGAAKSVSLSSSCAQAFKQSGETYLNGFLDQDVKQHTINSGGIFPGLIQANALEAKYFGGTPHYNRPVAVAYIQTIFSTKEGKETADNTINKLKQFCNQNLKNSCSRIRIYPVVISGNTEHTYIKSGKYYFTWSGDHWESDIPLGWAVRERSKTPNVVIIGNETIFPDVFCSTM